VGGTGRTGWVLFQRNPNLSYPASEGHGWNFRMYSGVGTGGQDVLTDADYTVNKWQHLVVTWEPQADNGDVGGNGNDQWQGILTAFVDGHPVASNTAALYAANRSATETAAPAADLAVGSYNVASGLGNNPYEGDVDELAFYNNYVLTPDQVLEHYVAGTNAAYGTNYETVVFRSAFTGPERAGLPKTYLRFNDPARYPAVNSGTLGSVADATLVLTSNIISGPLSPTYPGFESTNTALPLDGIKQFADFNNPSGLNTSGQITLEAWVKPGASQGATARIISHGPQTPTSFPGQGLPGSVTNTSEVFLRVDNSGANYTVGSAQYDDGTATTNIHAATFPVPGGDLGGASWVHLAGTYDGTNWRLYRNGALVATQASGVGALVVNDADWAIGSTGNGWADAFAGSIDEVAIYGTALSASKIQSHYNAGTVSPRLSIARSGGNVIITWPYGTLYEATNVTGPYTPVAGTPTSPFTTSAGASRKFYRF
jgi:hypothetical protein